MGTLAGLFLLSGFSLRSDQRAWMVAAFIGCGGGESDVIDGPSEGRQQRGAGVDY